MCQKYSQRKYNDNRVSHFHSIPMIRGLVITKITHSSSRGKKMVGAVIWHFNIFPKKAKTHFLGVRCKLLRTHRRHFYCGKAKIFAVKFSCWSEFVKQTFATAKLFALICFEIIAREFAASTFQFINDTEMLANENSSQIP